MFEQTVTLPTIITAALIDSLNPCAFALLLVFVATTLAMLQRQSDAAGAAHARRWLLSRGGIYVFGIFATYLALGLGLMGAMEAAKVLSGTHLISRAAAVIALGLGLVALQEALLPELGTRLSAHVDLTRMRGLVSRLSVPGLLAAGVLVGLCTVPCSGAVYLAVLALLTAQTTFAAGVGYLVLYNVVFVAPLVVLLALAASPPVYRRLARWQLHQRLALKLATSVVTISVGLLTLLVV
jgi:cytochrome c-type biogenesis protein